MKWLLTYLSSSIGKKQVMGATGCMLVLFVLGHMVGNLQLLLPDPEAAQRAFNTYSYLLTKSKLFLYSVEAALALVVIVHLYMAITLKLQNNKARGPVDYVVSARKGKKAFPTFVMIWTGLALAAFLVWHIWTLRNGVYYHYINPEVAGGLVVRDMWLTTVEILGNPLFATFYLIVMLLLGFHMWHAISSAFQTMGINHQKWTPIIDKVAILCCIAAVIGFTATAAGTWAIVNLNPKAKAIIEQAKDPGYQAALGALSERSLDEQRIFAKIIAKNPERAKFIVEREKFRKGEGSAKFKGKKFKSKDGKEKFKHKDGKEKFKHKDGKGKPKRHGHKKIKEDDIEDLEETEVKNAEQPANAEQIESTEGGEQ
ncbi:MAG: succinate dehydrogenase cytochrome b subunit [Fibromonadaceae bacterium]|jgi:succinate dehydrogenase / fumarate reductase cytochrome b subunit|nr:succinate dehydrogenase cytochrome b subunit [Fibromonadaceae bacterium]